MTHFDTSWYVLMHFDVFWCVLTCFDLFWFMSWRALKKCSTIWIQAKRKRFKCPNCGKIWCRQKFTKQTHKKYMHYEYPKFWSGIREIDVFWGVFMRFDEFWRFLICWHGLTCYDLCREELWKHVWLYWLKPEGNNSSAQIVEKFMSTKVPKTNTSITPTLWILKKVLNWWK